MTTAYYWDDDRKPLPRATRCLEDELLPPVEVAKGRDYVKAPKLKGAKVRAKVSTEGEGERRRTKLDRIARRVAAEARGEPVRFALRDCLWCTATTRRTDQCCGSRACEAAAEAEFLERRLRRMGRGKA